MRLGIHEPSPQRFKDLAVAFTVYHALKLGHRELVDAAVNETDFRELASKAKALAAAANIHLSSLIPS